MKKRIQKPIEECICDLEMHKLSTRHHCLSCPKLKGGRKVIASSKRFHHNRLEPNNPRKYLTLEVSDGPSNATLKYLQSISKDREAPRTLVSLSPNSQPKQLSYFCVFFSSLLSHRMGFVFRLPSSFVRRLRLSTKSPIPLVFLCESIMNGKRMAT